MPVADLAYGHEFFHFGMRDSLAVFRHPIGKTIHQIVGGLRRYIIKASQQKPRTCLAQGASANPHAYIFDDTVGYIKRNINTVAAGGVVHGRCAHCGAVEFLRPAMLGKTQNLLLIKSVQPSKSSKSSKTG